MNREDIISKIRKNYIVAIVRGVAPDDCVRLAEALYKGGIQLVEITFDQSKPESWDATAQAIKSVAAHMDGRMEVGAGTVCSVEQVDLAYRAGAKFIISPDSDETVISRTRACGMVSISGAFTPSEIKRSYEQGADFVKIFPATGVGPSFIKAVCAPLSHIPLLAVGGVDEKNVGEFLQAGAVGVGVGGNLVNKQWIKNGEFDKITAAAQEYVRAIGFVKGE